MYFSFVGLCLINCSPILFNQQLTYTLEGRERWEIQIYAGGQEQLWVWRTDGRSVALTIRRSNFGAPIPFTISLGLLWVTANKFRIRKKIL